MYSFHDDKSSRHGKVWSTVRDVTSTDAVPIFALPKDVTNQVEDEVKSAKEDHVEHVEEDLLDIVVKTATIYRGPPHFNVYPMKARPRGSVLIINNESFVNDVFSRRTGSSVDVKNLTSLFTQLHFEMICHNNLGRNSMMRTIRDFSSLGSHTTADMAVVCILSHGESHGNIITSDGQKLEMEWVLKQFNNSGCPGLHNKPKLFLLQACRGDEEDYGIPKSPSLTVDTTDNVAMGPRKRTISSSMPTWEDMLIAYAAVPGYVANRNHARGTWFIECFCQVLMEHSGDLDLREMFDEVAKNLSNFETESGRKQSFSYEARHFYNKLYFNPGIEAPEDYGDIVDNQRAAINNKHEEEEMVASEEIGTSAMIKKEETDHAIDTHKEDLGLSEREYIRKEERDEREKIRQEERNEREQIRQEERNERQHIRQEEKNERELIRKDKREEREKIWKEERVKREEQRNLEKEQIKMTIKEGYKEMEILIKERMDVNKYILMLSKLALVIALVSYIFNIKQ